MLMFKINYNLVATTIRVICLNIWFSIPQRLFFARTEFVFHRGVFFNRLSPDIVNVSLKI